MFYKKEKCTWLKIIRAENMVINYELRMSGVRNTEMIDGPLFGDERKKISLFLSTVRIKINAGQDFTAAKELHDH